MLLTPPQAYNRVFYEGSSFHIDLNRMSCEINAFHILEMLSIINEPIQLLGQYRCSGPLVYVGTPMAVCPPIARW